MILFDAATLIQLSKNSLCTIAPLYRKRCKVCAL